MRAVRAAAVAVGLAVALSGCDPVDLRELDGTQWRAVQVVDVAAMPGRPPMLTFSHGGASGFVICSSYTIGKVTVDETKRPAGLHFDDLSIAGAQCADRGQQRIETAFFDALTRAAYIDIESGRLVIQGAGGALVFERIEGPS